MTHEREQGDEPTGGPPLDDRLRPATEILVTEGPGAADEDVEDDEIIMPSTGRDQWEAGVGVRRTRAARERNRG